jgi:hypothetical protein
VASSLNPGEEPVDGKWIVANLDKLGDALEEVETKKFWSQVEEEL